MKTSLFNKNNIKAPRVIGGLFFSFIYCRFCFCLFALLGIWIYQPFPVMTHRGHPLWNKCLSLQRLLFLFFDRYIQNFLFVYAMNFSAFLRAESIRQMGMRMRISSPPNLQAVSASRNLWISIFPRDDRIKSPQA